MKCPRLSLPQQLFVMALLPVVAPLLLLLAERLYGPLSAELMRLLVALYLLWLSFHLYVLWRHCNAPFHGLANLVRALQLGDFTQRAAHCQMSDALGTLHEEINQLAEVLQDNRFAAVEANRRFQYLIDQLDIAVVAFSETRQLVWCNHQFSRLFGKLPAAMSGMLLADMQLEALWEASNGRTLWLDFPQKSSRWLVHTHAFRDEGQPQRLYLLTDLKNPLREEERTAWRRLIRVLGHELNNSLTPITSLSQSLRQRIAKVAADEEWKESSLEALEIISQRAQHMNRFVRDYASLAKLPEPERSRVELRQTVQHVVQLLGHPALRVRHAEDEAAVAIEADQGQFEQLLVNVLRNAIEAIDPAHGEVVIQWQRQNTDVLLTIDDNGPGIDHAENLFVPFYSTKEGGSGIGLVLSRQIAEANGGSIELANRPQGGCRVTVRLPHAG